MLKLAVTPCLPFIGLALTSPVFAQAQPGEGLAIWCESRNRCTRVVTPSPDTLQRFCVLLAGLKRDAIAERIVLEELRSDGWQTSEGLRHLDAMERVYRGYAKEAKCPPFVPRAQMPFSPP